MVLATDDTATATPHRYDGGTPVAHALLDTLVRWGVRRIYCCPGSTEAAILDALVTRDDIRLVLVTHESVAVAMAEGEARVSGRPAVAYLHTNVGMANGLAHLTSAQLAYAPVLVLNGLKASTLTGRRAFTTAEHPRDLVRQHVKWAHVSVAAGQVADDVDRALHAAVGEPAGPVWLGLPQDLLESDLAVAAPPSRCGTASPARASATAVAAAADLLAGADRPVLVAGADIARRGATDALLAVAERLGAPVVEEDRRDFVTSVVPTGHPLYAGRYDPASALIRDADVVAYLGCRVFTEFEAPGSPRPPAAARVLHLHADPAEVGRLHRADVALTGDAALTLADLRSALPPARRPASGAPTRTAPAAPAHPAGPGHRNLAPVIAAVADAVDRTDATVVLDATTATVPLLNGLRTRRPGQLLGSTSGSLGWGLGAALGAALGDPEHPVLCIVGDGAFQFGLPALWTARHTGVPVTFLVLNNGAYAAVASALNRFGGAAVARDRWPGTDIAGLDIAAAAAAFGLPARRLDATDPSLAEALRQGGPNLIEVVTTARRTA